MKLNRFLLIISCHLQMLRVACWFQRFGWSGILSRLDVFSGLHILDIHGLLHQLFPTVFVEIVLLQAA